MSEDELDNLVGMHSRQIADILESHQDVLEECEQICDDIQMSRRSLEFFISVKDQLKQLREVRWLQQRLLSFLGLS